MGTASYNTSTLTFVFNNATVPITTNATVKAGDHLGISISGSDFAPYCHLEYNTAARSNTKLFQRGGGQFSWRGLDGKTSIVYERIGKGVKFLVNYK